MRGEAGEAEWSGGLGGWSPLVDVGVNSGRFRGRSSLIGQFDLRGGEEMSGWWMVEPHLSWVDV